MSFGIERFTPQEKQEHKRQFPMSEPKEWAVMDSGMVWSFYDTQGEAEKELRGLIREDEMGERFGAWRTKIATEFGVSEGEVDEVVRGRVGEL